MKLKVGSKYKLIKHSLSPEYVGTIVQIRLKIPDSGFLRVLCIERSEILLCTEQDLQELTPLDKLL